MKTIARRKKKQKHFIQLYMRCKLLHHKFNSTLEHFLKVNKKSQHITVRTLIFTAQDFDGRSVYLWIFYLQHVVDRMTFQYCSMVLYGTYTEVQIATFTNCLPNLGVVLAGGRSSGVIVKAILPGSFAYKDGQIKQGDHLLAVNDVFVHGMTCDQVANLLRHNADGKIQMIVGRALKSSTSAKKHSRTTIRLPTDVVTNPALLKNHITNLNADFGHKSSASTERYQSAIVEPSKQQDVTTSAPQHTGSRNDELENLSSQACLVNRRKVDKKTVQIRDIDLEELKYEQLPKILEQQTANSSQLTTGESRNFYQPPSSAAATTSWESEDDSKLSLHRSYSVGNCDKIEETRKKWQPICGPEYNILLEIIIPQRFVLHQPHSPVVEFERSQCDETLGISLEGTVDIVGNSEQCPHHFIKSISEDSDLCSLAELLKPGDELLEVNDDVLYGKSYCDVLNVLRNLGKHVSIVCARRRSEFTKPQVTQAGIELLGRFEDQEDMSGSWSEKLDKAIIWSPYSERIMLVKGSEGLGFTIFEHKAFIDRESTAIVVHSLIPKGVAQKSGQILPGDRLLSVNDIPMTNLSLKKAIKILKATPVGPVTLEIARPLTLTGEVTADFDFEKLYLPFDISMFDALRQVEDLSEPLTDYISSSPCIEKEEYDETFFPPTASAYGTIKSISSTVCSVETNASSSSASSVKLQCSIPESLTKTIRIKKKLSSFGVKVEAAQYGSGGCIVKSIDKYSAVDFDGHLKVGDMLLSVNGQDLKYASRAQVKAIMRRVNLLTSDISVKYVPAESVKKYDFYQRRMNQRSSCSSLTGLSLKKFPEYYRSPYLSSKSLELSEIAVSESGIKSANSSLSLATAISCPVTYRREYSFGDKIDTANGEQLSSTDLQLTTSDEQQDPRKLPSVVGKSYQIPILSDKLEIFNSSDRSLLEKNKINDEQQLPFVGTGIGSGEVADERTEQQSEENVQNFETLDNDKNRYAEDQSAELGIAKLKPVTKIVEIHRNKDQYLGISIVGGKIEIMQGDNVKPFVISGVFVKSVLPNSAAQKCNQIKIGDRILSVNGISLINRPHEECVHIIRHAESPVVLILESFSFAWPHLSSTSENEPNVQQTGQTQDNRAYSSEEPGSQEKMTSSSIDIDNWKNSNKSSTGSRRYASIDSEQRSQLSTVQHVLLDNSPDNGLTGSTTTMPVDDLCNDDKARQLSTNGDCIVKAPTMSVKDDQLLLLDDELLERFGELNGELHVTELRKANDNRLGLALVGNKDRSKVSVLIAGIDDDDDESSAAFQAFRQGKLSIGDEILQVDDVVIHGRSHLNASSIIKNRPNSIVRLVVLRRPNGAADLAIDPAKMQPSGDVLRKVSDPHAEFSFSKQSQHEDTSPAAITMDAETSTHTTFACDHHSKYARTTDVKPIAEKTDVTEQISKTGSTTVQTQSTKSLKSASNPATDSIVQGCETLIEIDKSGKGLGLSLVGGSDTILGSIVVHEIYPDGAAAMDGRLAAGDQILEVNGRSIRDAAHEVAINLLRQTPSKVRLLVHRDPKMKINLLDPTNIYDIFEVELNKKPGKGLGLSIVGRKHEPGIFIAEVMKGGIAESSGRLFQGDQLLAVNGKDLTASYQEEAATLLKTATGIVKLKIGRIKVTSSRPKSAAAALSAASDSSAQPALLNCMKISPEPSRRFTTTHGGRKDKGRFEASMKTEGRSKSLSPREESNKKSCFYRISRHSFKFDRNRKTQIADTDDNNYDIIEVQLTKNSNQPWGMGVGKRPKGILITSVQPNSLVDGKLHLGDRILAVNYQPVLDQASARSWLPGFAPCCSATNLIHPKDTTASFPTYCTQEPTGHFAAFSGQQFYGSFFETQAIIIILLRPIQEIQHHMCKTAEPSYTKLEMLLLQ
ncbi:InaD-like protein [Trichinella nelsoni]|uniref:InaD-like protein n=1 Tax=Trichinella nelsoni TaxID=6336 RepID=A0A0V0S6G3_9BILA|nr:InaD-like protein [Trichinella nelsoni]